MFLFVSTNSGFLFVEEIGLVAYSRGEYASLPMNNDDLTTLYTSTEYANVAVIDNITTDQTCESANYVLHQFKNDVGVNTHCNVHWVGLSERAPNMSPVYLQIYNTMTTNWETLDSNSIATEHTSFSLTTSISNITNYKDINNIVTFRVCQLNNS